MGHNWAHLLHMAGHATIHLINHKKKHGDSAAHAVAAEQQRLARAQAEREPQAALAYQARLQAVAYEEDRPKRNLRNLGRAVGCIALGIVAVVLIANQNILWGVITTFTTVAAVSAAKKSWER